jgi:hypothetical protein
MDAPLRRSRLRRRTGRLERHHLERHAEHLRHFLVEMVTVIWIRVVEPAAQRAPHHLLT